MGLGSVSTKEPLELRRGDPGCTPCYDTATESHTPRRLPSPLSLSDGRIQPTHVLIATLPTLTRSNPNRVVKKGHQTPFLHVTEHLLVRAPG